MRGVGRKRKGGGRGGEGEGEKRQRKGRKRGKKGGGGRRIGGREEGEIGRRGLQTYHLTQTWVDLILIMMTIAYEVRGMIYGLHVQRCEQYVNNITAQQKSSSSNNIPYTHYCHR